MTLLLDCLLLFYTFFKIGIVGFGGGYAMISMIMIECERFGITMAQFADMNALEMVVPGPLAINAATYTGYTVAGFWGALSATVGVTLPSLIVAAVALHFLGKYKDSAVIDGVLSGVKPAAVGLIASAAALIAASVLLKQGAVGGGGADVAGSAGFARISAFIASAAALVADPLGTISILAVAVFAAVAVANIRFKVNPILLTLAAGVVGAVFEFAFGG
jgi:chromate transporter